MGNHVVSVTSTSTDEIKVDKYVSMGASDTLGIGALNPLKDSWVQKFASLINVKQIINLGSDGSTMKDAVDQQLPQVFNYKPNVITIWLAVNDYYPQTFDQSILDGYASNLDEMLSQLRNKLDKNTRILVGNMPHLAKIPIYKSFGVPEGLLMSHIKQWNDCIGQIVIKHQCDLVDLYSYSEELGEHPEYISSDGFHPSTIGYERLAQVFFLQYLK